MATDPTTNLRASAASIDSWSVDDVSAVGLQNIDVTVDAEATIAATSTAKSAAKSENVTGSSGSLSDVAFNSGLQASGLDAAGVLNTNTFNVSSSAGLSGTATTTANASAATSAGAATGFATIGDAAGISDVSQLDVGGELTALGKAVSTITGSAETVVGSATGTGSLSGAMQGFQAADIDVSSDASIQGLAQLTNRASAAATSGTTGSSSTSTATAYVNNLEGVSLDGLDVGGVASLAGQASLGNTSNATNVVGAAIASSELLTANALEATGTTSTTPFGIDVSSDATITGLSSITSSATAATTAGKADADSIGGTIQGIDIADAQIGGIGSLTGQSNFTGNAKSSNVTGDNSTADSTLTAAGGLDASDLVDVSSDATLKGLSSINMSAMAESTGAAGAVTLADAAFSGGNVTGASLDAVDIGGVGNVLGQVGFTGAATASNVTGKADATGDLASAMGLKTMDDMTVSSDGTIKGLASVTGSATAATTAGDANAAALANDINGADFNDLVDIGGIGSIQGAASFNLSAKSTNVTAGTGTAGSDATAGDSTLDAIGLQSVKAGTTADTTFGIDIASDASISGTAIGSLKAEAFSTATSADALVGNGADLFGAQIGDLNVGGIGSVTGAAQLTGNGTASSVVGAATATTGLDAGVTGLDASLFNVASDATITAQAFGTLNATASSTGGNATARAGGDGTDALDAVTSLTGLDSGLDLNIGGVGTLSALAQGSESATATTVDGISTASAAMDLMGAAGLDFASSSDGSLTGVAKLAATVDASNIGGSIKNDASANGDFSAIGFSGLDIGKYDGPAGATDVVGIGGISTLKGQAQITGTLNAESVSGDAFAGKNDPQSVVMGMYDVVMNGASDGTILGTASGVFNTNAVSTGGEASGYSNQSLKGISMLDLNLGGNGGINAIVNDTNFVSASSVSGNATAVASVDAIGLEGGNIHIAGNATIMANVGVDSKAEAVTVG